MAGTRFFDRAEAGQEHTTVSVIIPGKKPGETTMKIKTIALATVLALTSTFAPAHTGHRHHRMHYSRGSSNPNGTAGGPTTLSGTGSSQFGGSLPGTTGKN
jgi:hypothetical protein